jgi:hypothetical protein
LPGVIDGSFSNVPSQLSSQIGAGRFQTVREAASRATAIGQQVGERRFADACGATQHQRIHGASIHRVTYRVNT